MRRRIRESLAIAEEPADHASISSSSFGGARRQQLLGAEPGAAGEVDRVALLRELLGAVRVGGEGQSSARATGGAGQRVVEVEARAAVDLERGAGAGRRLEDARPVERQRVAAVHDPPEGCAITSTWGFSIAASARLRQLLARLVSAGVDAGDDHVEARQQLVRVVEAGVGPDLELGAVEDPEGRQLRVEPGDLGSLRVHAVRRQPSRDTQRRRVVREHDVLVADVARRASHRLDGVDAIGPVRMGVGVAAHVVRG